MFDSTLVIVFKAIENRCKLTIASTLSNQKLTFFTSKKKNSIFLKKKIM